MCDRSEVDMDLPDDFMLNSFRNEHGREPRSDDEFMRWSEAELAKMSDALDQLEAADAQDDSGRRAKEG